MNNQDKIQAIIDGCRAEDPKCQKALLSLYADKIYAVALRYVKDTHIAQEIVQDTFIKMFKSMNNYDEAKGTIDGYMRKVAVRFALKRLNKKRIPVNIIEENIYDKFQLEPKAIQKLESDDLMELIKSLPEGYRQVFNLYVIEGHSHKEIADMIGIKEVSSRSNLSRAKEILRKKLIELKPYESWAKIY